MRTGNKNYNSFWWWHCEAKLLTRQVDETELRYGLFRREICTCEVMKYIYDGGLYLLSYFKNIFMMSNHCSTVAILATCMHQLYWKIGRFCLLPF